MAKRGQIWYNNNISVFGLPKLRDFAQIECKFNLVARSVRVKTSAILLISAGLVLGILSAVFGGVVVSRGVIDVNEEGATWSQYTIGLTSGPSAAVQIYLNDLSEPNQVAVPGVVTFTTGQQGPKPVTVTAINDSENEGDPHWTLIRHRVVSGDTNYNGVYVDDVGVRIKENDCGGWGYLQGDFNHDCKVDFSDYAIMAEKWLESTIWGEVSGDTNGDFYVDSADLDMLAEQWLECTTPGKAGCIRAKDIALKCEYLENPLGVDVNQPRLSWVVETERRGYKQTAYQVLVASKEDKLAAGKADLWDSGKVDSNQSLNILYNGTALSSGKVYYWKVRVWDNEGNVSGWSRPAFWTMGLMNESDWAGIWINDGKATPSTYARFFDDDPAPLFRKEFTVSKPVRRAMLYISGLGYYEASLNGDKIGDAMMDPAWMVYRKRVPYRAYDVTGMLETGQNCIGVVLGNGWYNPLPMELFCSVNFRDYLTVGRPRLISQLDIEYEDGSSSTVATDTNWKVTGGPLLRNNVYIGTRYDARLEVPGWNIAGFDDSGWTDANESPGAIGRLRSQLTPPVKMTGIVKPVAITHPQSGVYIFDMGQNFAGVARLKVNAPAGTRVRMRYGELLNSDGTLNVDTTIAGFIGSSWCQPKPPGIADQNDVYLCKGGGEEVYSASFTFHGFRYVELTGYPGTPILDTVEGLRMNSAVERVGTFMCSNSMFNRIWDMFDWTLRSNLFSIQSDCPGRERLGYGGDIVSSSEAAMFDLDMSNFYAKVVHDFADDVRDNNGFTETAPYVGIADSGFGGGSGPLEWGTAHPLLLRQLYQYYGNKGLMEEQYEAARKYLNFLDKQDSAYIINAGISDHATIDAKPVALTGTAFFYYNAKLCSEMAAILGKTADASTYAALAANIKTAFNNRFFNSGTGVYDTGTEACQSFALYFDLVPDGHKNDVVNKLISSIVVGHSGHLSTGIFGTKYMLDELTENGKAYAAYAIANQKTYPGYGYMIANGATTIWESWDGGASQNHPMFGSVCEWFFKTLAGIKPAADAVGFDKVIIKPQLVDGLTWARGNYESVRGQVESFWRLEGGSLSLDVTIPANAEAKVYVPAGDVNSVTEGGEPVLSVEGIEFAGIEDGAAVFNIGSGKYHFVSLSPVIHTDNDAPTPAVMSWETVPYPVSSSKISMTVASAVDLSGG